MKQTVFHAFLLSALLAAPASLAQSDLPPRDQNYMRDVVTLSSTLGRVHAIRRVCNGTGDQFWRDYMVEFLNMEAPRRGNLRSSMTDAFNDAFQRESRLRPVCDKAARDAEAIYAGEGRRLSNALAERYLPKR